MKRFLLLSILLLLTTHAQAQVVIQLTKIPEQTPKGAVLYAAGSFNSWSAADPAYAFTRTADEGYKLTLPASIAGSVEFKITKGSWATVETDAHHQDIANRQLTIGSKPAIVELQVAGWKDAGQNSGLAACRSTALQPQVQILDTAFQMPQLQRQRRIWIYLPNDYNTAAKKHYPVLYMHDGQNVFDACTSFSGEWGVDETLSQLQQQGLDAAGCIVVAVDNGGAERLNELSPWRNTEYGGGQGKQYIDFLVHTLKPYIDVHYRTLTGREFTGIAGSSMGGLISTYAALKYPLVYSKVGVFSPAFWFAKDSLFQYVGQNPANTATRFYFVSGTTESETMAPLMQTMYTTLRQQRVPTQNLAYAALQDGKHAEWFWKREFLAAYQMLYKEGQEPTALACSIHTGLAADKLQVDLPVGVRTAQLEIVDSTGRSRLRIKVKSGSEVSVGQLAQGEYVLRVSASKQSSTQLFDKE
ncbi:alpha/beta hydrolase-fold protein [Hymenobacter wooponensis]|uniref:Alpha/beta hydrolase n=1 Tax=Hymenobacter wooponensis TaxID=1525360 RepID=A0A4Z0MSC9_9BACT|nr:alpha/beta hydrolase-fold protein [Hymenobacter wooponensis]TGD82359.1 alpha/beta hydrolase [Hymenobacter wooponensis]